MEVVCGLFNELEREFCLRVRSVQAEPLAPALVIAPSHPQADRLAKALALENGCSAAVSFHTFLSLAARLSAEAGLDFPPLVSDSGFRTFALKAALEKNSFGFSPENGFAEALRSSLKDLEDGCVNPATVLEHLSEGAFDKGGNSERVERLARLYGFYVEFSSRLPAASHGAVFSAAAKAARQSAWLASFREIIFYGFYDLTGLQLELFRAVADNFQSSLFFPLIKHPAFSFAARFYEANAAGPAGSVRRLEPENTALGGALISLFRPEAPAQKAPGVSVFSVSGARDELWLAAKEILRLVETEGFRHDEIAVVARSLEPYREYLPQVFGENKIPFHSPAALPLLSRPPARAAFSLLGFLRENFSARRAREIVSSPYFRRRDYSGNWPALIDSSGVTEGWRQWPSLLRPENPAFRKGDWAGPLSALRGWLSETKIRLENLERPGDWAELAGEASAFVDDNFDSAVFSQEEAIIRAAIKAEVEFLKQYSAVRPARAGEFLDELLRRLEAAELKPFSALNCGTAVLDAMSARGISARAVILLGLNEKIFPRVVREDPVLRDADRRLMRDAEGFWISPKLEGSEEEKLLFFLCVSSAREKLLAVYQRSDAGGNTLVPSLYLAELCRACGISPDEAKHIPRQQLEKISGSDETLLSEKEFSLKISLGRKNAEELRRRAGISDKGLSRLWPAALELSGGGPAGERDGISAGAKGFELAEEKGLAPTRAEILSKCPMRYFLGRVVGLPDDAETFERGSLSPRLKGGFYHEILTETRRRLRDGGQTSCAISELDSVFEDSLGEKAAGDFGLYPVVWELEREQMLENLKNFLADDIKLSGGFRPEYFEKEISGPAPGGLRWNARADRIDVDPEKKTYRIVDYKKSARGTSPKLDKLVGEGEILQPYLYPALAEESLDGLKGFEFSGSVFLNIEDSPETTGKKRIQELSASSRAELSPQVEETISFLVSLLKKGAFFLRPKTGPGGWCSNCGFSSVCRKNHGASARRARHSPLFKERERLAHGG